MRTMPHIAALVAFLLVAAGCSPADDALPLETATVSGADYNPVDRSRLQRGGEVVWPVEEIPPQLNPLHAEATGDTSRIWNWFSPQLILMTPDGEAYANPAYLSEWTNSIVDGKRELRITFQDQAAWNDGTPMTWESIRLTWIAQSGRDDAFRARTTDGYAKIESVEQGPTPRTAVVTFEDEYPWVGGMFWDILHPDVNSAEAFNTAYDGEPHPEWGAGPYTISSSSTDAITLVPNEKWWGNEPLLDAITFQRMDAVAALNAFRGGELDAVRTGSADSLAQVADMDDVTTYRAQRVETTLLQLNSDHTALSDLAVRRAIMHTVDRNAIAQTVWEGLNFAEETPGSFILYPFQEGYEDSLSASGWRHDILTAATTLHEAGWLLGSDGYRYRDNERLSLRLPIFGSDPSIENRARMLQRQLAGVGVEVVIDQRRQDELSTTFAAKDWDAIILAFTSSDPYGVAWICQLYCSESTLNLTGTGSADIDERISDVLSLPTEALQTATGIELEAEIMAETWGLLPLYSGPEIWTVRTGLANLTPEPYTGLDLFGVQPVEDVGWLAR
ncbi:peptide/nickel transport system substrate-binding protein [Microbacterium amylolyticum]|uniref:Peptide/nickel transport system substrate-binding protein n=2 Tax=Microbacterium amylolyticum TaxID=936337 RepID=A0ABS4ZED9_9MICO|nr:peptide/nickel transport system substrate-binding protein [Microbacterium amylolyticum]